MAYDKIVLAKFPSDHGDIIESILNGTWELILFWRSQSQLATQSAR